MNWIIYPIAGLGGAALAVSLVFLTGESAQSRTEPLTYAADAPRVLRPSVLLAGVQGAPSDGNTALSSSIEMLLAEARVPLVKTPNRCTISVSAEVSTQTRGETDQISIVWQVFDADGRSLGEVAQSSALPVGTLDRGWGQDATQAARGARAGIIEILNRKRGGCA